MMCLLSFSGKQGWNWVEQIKEENGNKQQKTTYTTSCWVTLLLVVQVVVILVNSLTEKSKVHTNYNSYGQTMSLNVSHSEKKEQSPKWCFWIAVEMDIGDELQGKAMTHSDLCSEHMEGKF